MSMNLAKVGGWRNHGKGIKSRKSWGIFCGLGYLVVTSWQCAGNRTLVVLEMQAQLQYLDGSINQSLICFWFLVFINVENYSLYTC